MKWVKATDRLPVPLENLNLKVNGHPASGHYKKADVDVLTTFGPNKEGFLGSHFFLAKEYFHLVEWLDESEPITTFTIEDMRWCWNEAQWAYQYHVSNQTFPKYMKQTHDIEV